MPLRSRRVYCIYGGQTAITLSKYSSYFNISRTDVFYISKQRRKWTNICRRPQTKPVNTLGVMTRRKQVIFVLFSLLLLNICLHEEVRWSVMCECIETYHFVYNMHIALRQVDWIYGGVRRLHLWLDFYKIPDTRSGN